MAHRARSIRSPPAGNLTGATWTGSVAWAGKVAKEKRAEAIAALGIAAAPGPADWYLTELEDPWPYRAAPSDLVFAKSATQDDVRREPIIRYTRNDRTPDGMYAALVVALGAVVVRRRARGAGENR